MNWQGCKNILCIRPDNMGDLIMSGPAIRALKKSFGARITLLTSIMAKGITLMMPEIDEVMVYDVPWVKTAEIEDTKAFYDVIADIKNKNFDAAVVFTVYSQNPQPTAMLAYLAGVPQILAYCRENPYQLINNWVPDKEPYELIKHQVKRDLDLVAAVGAYIDDDNLSLDVDNDLWPAISNRISKLGVDLAKPWLLIHPGVSESKREYPFELWVEAGKRLVNDGYQLIVTGAASEKQFAEHLADGIGTGCYSAAGLFPLNEFVCLVKHSPLLVSVNTGTIHIAAAVGTPVVVLYAQTNPQHTPWKVPHVVLPFAVPVQMRSRNEVIGYVDRKLYDRPVPMPNAGDISNAVTHLLNPQDLPVQPSPGIPDENPGIAAS
ncbi:glycosyltransferase family 9 protein [Mucilaginibacter achroorhodeus]|uniref:Glycosyltransferase family 9 protein n=1 Tax=Mucilaginibacter achroorhodeus TaxID=2599294 RepID=A0A563U4I5_9SPHI|nr:glycosyltransferase family 9 protein [Mucilaginibacter achroorhodeus]TWR26232.1 glycosyltransferase family 9 protein [Mucilaginibacter achroorhodeus]